MTSKIRYLLIVSVLLAMVFSLAGCSGNKLAENYDEQTVRQAAHAAIEKMNEGDFDAITNEMIRDDLKTVLSATVLSGAADQILAGAGAFESYADDAVGGTKDNKTGEDYATAVVVVQYTNKKVTYTISFDNQMKIVGFFMK